MSTLFFDCYGETFFKGDYVKVMNVLHDLERRSNKEFVKWSEFYEGLELPIPYIAMCLPYIGRADHQYRISFDVYPNDEDLGPKCIIITCLN